LIGHASHYFCSGRHSNLITACSEPPMLGPLHADLSFDPLTKEQLYSVEENENPALILIRQQFKEWRNNNNPWIRRDQKVFWK